MNIEVVARRSGVPPATLRKWEQRYGVLKPERTPGRHRRYSERDLLRVIWLKDRLAEGYRIGEAARLLGGGQLEPAQDSLDVVEQLLSATLDPDPALIARTLDLAFELLGPAQAIANVIQPTLTRVGELWERGEISVAAEHHLSEQVLAKLLGFVNGAAGGARGTAVICCGPGERHECGPLSLAVLLQTDGWRIAYLGPDTPLAGAAALGRKLGARALCVSATIVEHGETARRELDEVQRTYPRLAVVLGGAAFGGPTALEAVEQLRALAA